MSEFLHYFILKLPFVLYIVLLVNAKQAFMSNKNVTALKIKSLSISSILFLFYPIIISLPVIKYFPSFDSLIEVSYILVDVLGIISSVYIFKSISKVEYIKKSLKISQFMSVFHILISCIVVGIFFRLQSIDFITRITQQSLNIILSIIIFSLATKIQKVIK